MKNRVTLFSFSARIEENKRTGEGWRGGQNYPHRKKGQNKFQKTEAKALESERDRDWGGGSVSRSIEQFTPVSINERGEACLIWKITHLLSKSPTGNAIYQAQHNARGQNV